MGGNRRERGSKYFIGSPARRWRPDYLAGHPAAALVFQRNKHIINVFLWPTATGRGPDDAAPARRGYNIVSWRQAELQFCAVSDLNRPELESFAASYWGK
ncbi:MAG TPA: hypothetical protein VLW54_11825 [Candidatus Acidoferrales bacterium]|nr:hypothetical protein [Candidatus Acidoferrales bacterium]